MSESLENSYFATLQKDKFSFGKSPRFPQIKSHYTVDYFEKPEIRNRAASIGYGKRFDFFDQRVRSPSPFQYTIQDKSQESKKPSFGYSRNELAYGSYINPEIFKKKDERSYDIHNESSVTKKKQPAYGMTSKHPSDSFVHVRKQFLNKPNPTKYDPSDSTFSKRKKSPTCKFSSSKRFNYEVGKDAAMLETFRKITGPGAYNPNFQKTRNVTFDHAVRKTFVDEETKKNKNPGPQYNVK